MRVGAIIFDMDDTLAATAPIWRAAEERLLASIGHSYSPELAASYKGMNALDLAAVVHRELGPAVALAEFQQRMRTMLLESYSKAAISAIPGAVALAQRLAGLAPMAVASGSPLPAIGSVLDELGIAHHFQHLITSESVRRGKPHPAVFLAAGGALSVAPASCVVFEDSLVGGQAARAAGMRCIVRPSVGSPDLPRYADRIVQSWDQVNASMLSEVVS